MQQFLVVVMMLGLTPAVAQSQCPPEGFSHTALIELKQEDFQIESDEARNDLAVKLLECTAHPDPAIRDGVAYGGLSTWLRADLLSGITVQHLVDRLLHQLRGTPDTNGFKQPFAALVLSEVVRTDRVTPAFTPETRQELVEAASFYLESVEDYRGFSDREGWRHGVAHGADLVLQLVLNPAIDESQTTRLLEAVRQQVAPENEVFYVYGEPSRLARPVFYAHQRQLLDRDWWVAWLDRVTEATPLETWQQAWSSNAGLAKRHNTLAFLVALHFNAVNSGNEAGQELADLILEAIKHI
ncbi:MAG: DUF2785 domain-containing protein [Xanthomonadales bacterium]|nr:DUF2785 domain-containing protein [Xanthomonadales bacterium]NNL94196.1 DUF2785 domain-containing protein [Xanthomonadales bacterium]